MAEEAFDPATELSILSPEFRQGRRLFIARWRQIGAV